jgi:hypothetical protein
MICFQDIIGIHYDDLGLYKELLYFIEAKAWRVNEFVILTIHFADITEDIIEVLEIDILPHFTIDATAMFRKSGQVHSVKWLIIIQ